MYETAEKSSFGPGADGKDVPVIAKGGRVARRDVEKLIGEIRGMLADPTTGLIAQHQVQESRHGKVLEHVTYSTTGVREENRELRRRQERMLTELGQVRSAVDALRREIAQAWAHIVAVRRAPRPGKVPDLTVGRHGRRSRFGRARTARYGAESPRRTPGRGGLAFGARAEGSSPRDSASHPPSSRRAAAAREVMRQWLVACM